MIKKKGEMKMGNLFWIVFTALCALGLVVMIPFMLIEFGREGHK